MNYLALGGAAVIIAASSQQPLTLDEAIRLAEHNAFSLRTAASNIEKSRQKVVELRGGLGPKVSAVAAETHTFQTSAGFTVNTGSTGGSTGGGTGGGTGGTTGGSTGGGTGGVGGVSSAKDTPVATFSLTLPIDLSGITRKGIRAAQYSNLASKASYAAADNDLRLSVKQAFFQVLAAKAQVDVGKQALSDAQAQLKNAQQKLDAGILAKFDVLRFETANSQAEADLISDQNSLTLAKENLNNVIARPIETEFDVADIAELPKLPGAAEDLVKTAWAQRPEVEAAKDNIESLRNVRMSQEGTFDPSLSAGVTHLRLYDPNNFATAFSQTQGFLNLVIPLYDSGVTRARVKEARQDEAQAQIQYEQLKLSISLEVRQAVSDLSNQRAILDVAQRQVEEASEAYRLAVVKFRAGEGTTLDVTDAQTQLTKARTGFVSARYNFLKSYAALQRAIDADAGKAPPVPAPATKGAK